jgi:hypothetical protein
MIHAAVVLVPLLALGGIAYAVAPFIRRHFRWPVGLLALAAPGAVVGAKLSGDQFKKNPNMSAPQQQAKIANHENFGNTAMWWTLGLGVAVLVLVILVRAMPNPTRRGPDDTLVTPRSSGTPLLLQIILGVVTVGLAGIAMYYVFKTGDSGAHMVWDGF